MFIIWFHELGGKTDNQKKNLPYVNMENNINPEPVLVQIEGF